VTGQRYEGVTGQRYEDYAREHILQPLRMTRTDFAYDGASSDDVSTGHHPRLHPLTPVLRRSYRAGSRASPTAAG
jgi:CubicO group peptidase (beta-lactamase class C family)